MERTVICCCCWWWWWDEMNKIATQTHMCVMVHIALYAHIVASL